MSTTVHKTFTIWATVLLFVRGQAVYYPTKPIHHCAPTPSFPAQPSFYHANYTDTLRQTVRTAVSVAKPSATTTYAPPFSSLRHLIQHVSTTTWGAWYPDATTTPTDSLDPYGQAAFTSLWDSVNVTANFTRGIYSTTVSPTPIPKSELLLPPPMWFGPCDCYAVPKDFIFGVAGAAAQIEGAVADEGRGPAITDLFVKGVPPALSNDLSPDEVASNFVADENYYLYKQDIERLAAIGIKHYSFSISWSRILPFAVPGSPVNAQGLKHYEDLVDFVLEKGMVPIVTLFHWDAPVVIVGTDPLATSEGGLLLGNFNAGVQNSTFREAFVHYGKIVMTHLASRVPIWITFNEPQITLVTGPSVDNVIKSHADLWHFYHEEIKGTGRLSMKMGESPGVPQDPANPSHVFAAQWFNDLLLGLYLTPLALGQDYPLAVKSTIQDYVPLSPQDLQYVGGTLDFIGVDIYSVPVIVPLFNNIAEYISCARLNDTTQNPAYPYCVDEATETTTGWALGYGDKSPDLLRTQLSYLWNTYKQPVMVTEFGLALSTADENRYDIERTEMYWAYLNEMLKAIWEDGVEVLGALMWTFVDDWEWGRYDAKFGLQDVNRTTMERTYRRGLFDVVDFVEGRRMG